MTQWIHMLDCLLQFSTEELVKEVENSVAEFKRHNQDYDEERVKEQVGVILPIFEEDCCYCSYNSRPLQLWLLRQILE